MLVKSGLELMVGAKEKILWQGRPNKKCYILEGLFILMLRIAFSGLFFNSTFILVSTQGDTDGWDSSIIIPLLILNMTLVWIYLAGILFVFRKYKHTEYIVTDKGVYVSGGLFAYTCQMKPFTEISHINIHRGIFDQQLKVGDVVFSGVNDDTAPDINANGRPISRRLSISNIPDYQKVFELVKELQIDIFSDTMYPNDLRPEENHGYRTKSKGL